jgi:hypothetical protein
VAAVAALWATPARALPPGYFIDSTQAVAPRPAELRYDDGDFTLAVVREFADSTEARLLGIAEATYPPRERLEVLSIANRTEVGRDSARTSLWWYDGVGVTRVPYAVTAGALQYYTSITEQFRAHDFWGSFAHPLFWTDLNYHARIARRAEYALGFEEFEDVYVAQMTLGWGYNDGTFVPISLAYRIVVLTPQGDVLRVEGDGMIKETVRLSEHRGIGYVNRIFR